MKGKGKVVPVLN